MVILESYPIHRCIFRDDQDTLKELLLDENIKKRINERDNHGNTPIHLALMLGRRNCVIILINNGCDVITRNNFRWNPTEEALMLNDIDIVERLINVKYRDYMRKLSEDVKSWTKVLPNCYLKVQLKLKSSIPIFNMLSAKDQIEFLKKGNSFRINTTIAGIEKKGLPKIYKGNMSVLFKFDESIDMHRIYILNNEKKIYQEIFPNTPQYVVNLILKSKMGISTLYKYFFDPRFFSVKFKKQKFLQKNKRETIKMETGKAYKTDKFKVKDLTLVIRKRDNEVIIGDYKSEIHTDITKIDYYIKDRIESCNNNTQAENGNDEININEKSFVEEDEEIADNDESDDIDDESDDNDDSDNESIDVLGGKDDDSSEKIKNNNVKKIEHSIFEHLINEKTVVDGKISEENAREVFKIFNRGHDDHGNKVTALDFKYVNQFIPNYFDEIIKEKFSSLNSSDKFKYLKFITTLNDKRVKCNVSKDGKTKIYEFKNYYSKSMSMDSTIFDQYTKILENDRAKKANMKKIEEELNKKKKLTEEEYFDSSKTENMHIGRIMNISEERKHYSNFVTLWLSKENEFPISLSQFRPIIHYVNGVVFDHINVKNTDNDLDRDLYINVIRNCARVLQSDRRFPLKLSYPFYPTMKFVIKYLNCYIEEDKISDDNFNIQNDYSYSSEALFKGFS